MLLCPLTQTVSCDAKVFLFRVKEDKCSTDKKGMYGTKGRSKRDGNMEGALSSTG